MNQSEANEMAKVLIEKFMQKHVSIKKVTQTDSPNVWRIWLTGVSKGCPKSAYFARQADGAVMFQYSSCTLWHNA